MYTNTERRDEYVCVRVRAIVCPALDKAMLRSATEFIPVRGAPEDPIKSARWCEFSSVIWWNYSNNEAREQAYVDN